MMLIDDNKLLTEIGLDNIMRGVAARTTNVIAQH